MSKSFRPHKSDALFLLPPDVRDWLEPGHLALFVSDVVEMLDLRAIMVTYDKGNGSGMPPFHPAMMVKLLIYGYCTGKTSSRKIERATYDEVPYRVLAANQHPDHDSIAGFRKRHLTALAGLFAQVLRMAGQMGMVKLGNVALDGTKVKANASKHKAMSYQRMVEAEARLKQEVADLLAKAAQTDEVEDAAFGKGRRNEDLPAELRRRENRLAKIAEAKAALEKQAKEMAEVQAEAARERIAQRKEQERVTGKKPRGKDPEVPDPEQAKPEPTAQRNFTDPESRIMLDGASKGFEQCYNAQAAVDGDHQIIVAAAVTQQGNDKNQLVPMVAQIETNTGCLPNNTLADSGYFSEANVDHPDLGDTTLLIPPNRQKHNQPIELPETDGHEPQTVADSEAPQTAADRMRTKLGTAKGKAAYALRKTIVEPVFGQIKQVRGFRRFSFRGLVNVSAEWLFVCATHNLLKIFRSAKPLQLRHA